MSEQQSLPSEKEQLDFYDKLRMKLVRFLESKTGKKNKFTEYLLFAPDLFHLLVKALMDPTIDGKNRALIGGAVAYFMLPLDFLPEGLIGFGGYMDDIIMATFVVNVLVNRLGPSVIGKHWSGSQQLMEVLQEVANVSDEVVNKIPVKSLLGNFILDKGKELK
ncbi:MAG: DUF1232 domain-containing protein [Lysinibacillus sp.]